MEADLEAGRRSSRHAHIESRLRSIIGAEAGAVFNNNAAAVMLALAGLMHSYALTGRDTVIDLPLLAWVSGQWTPGRALFPAGGAALGYALAALVFLLARFITVPRSDDEVA